MGFYILPIVVLIAVIYWFTVIPKVKRQSESGMQALKESLKGREEELRQAALTDASQLKLIADAVKEEKIEGIVSSLEKRDVKQVMKQKLVNDVSNVFKEKLGISFDIKDNQDAYYLVLTHQALHYLVFDEGKVKQQLTFHPGEMKNVKLGKAGVGDAMLKGGQQRFDKIEFEHQGEKQVLFYTPGVFVLPATKTSVGDKMAEWMILFAEPFQENLARRLGIPQ